MAGNKLRFAFFFLLFVLLSLLLLEGWFTANKPVLASTKAEKKGSLTFEKEGEDPVICFKDENLFAYFHREDRLLRVDGTEEIPLKELLKGEKISLIFHLINPFANDSHRVVVLEPCKVSLQLAKNPVYWRLVTENKSVGVGNFTVKSTEKFKKLLPEEIKDLTAEYQVLRTDKDIQEILLVIKPKKEADTGVETDQVDRKTGTLETERSSGILKSSLPTELSSLDFKKDRGELIGRLELKADYDFKLPLVLKGENKNEYTPIIQGKLTLVIWKNVYND